MFSFRPHKIKLEFDDTRRRVALAKREKLLTFVISEEHMATSAHIPKIHVDVGDMISTAYELASLGKKVALLNFASDKQIGGGVERGAFAQEEQLCVRTELYSSLLTQVSLYREGNMQEVLVSHGVHILKDHYLQPVPPLAVTIITAAAPRRPRTIGGVITNPQVLTNVRVKMRKILQAAKGCDVLILGAWGCGAFRCPPGHMAELMFYELKQLDYEVRFVVLGNPVFLAKLRTYVPESS